MQLDMKGNFVPNRHANIVLQQIVQTASAFFANNNFY